MISRYICCAVLLAFGSSAFGNPEDSAKNTETSEKTSENKDLSESVAKLAKTNQEVVKALVNTNIEILNAVSMPVLELLQDLQKKGIVLIDLGNGEYEVKTKKYINRTKSCRAVDIDKFPDITASELEFIMNQQLYS